MLREINEIILHCTDTASNVEPATIDRVHRKVNGWKMCGYHYLIRPNGDVYATRPLAMVGAHCKGHNAHSIGIAYIGRTPTSEQITAMKELCLSVASGYCLGTPKISKHCDYNKYKTCPNLTDGQYNEIVNYVINNN